MKSSNNMKTVADINEILNDITITPTFKKFIVYSEKIQEYIRENELFNIENQKLFVKNNFAFYSKISLFYYKWDHFILNWLLQYDNPCLARFIMYHRYISKLRHKRTSYKYFNLPMKIYTECVIYAFKTLSQQYDLGIYKNKEIIETWDFHYKNFINISPKFGIPITITLYDMYDQWHFENAFQSCVQNKLNKMLT